MSRRRKLLLFGGLFLAYNVATGGGLVVERTDSLSTLGSVTEAKLTDDASVYLKATPATSYFCIPLVFYYFRETYPFELRYYGSTRDGSVHVSEAERPEFATNVVVTGVRWYRKPDDGRAPDPSAVFHGSTWDGIVIPGPGEWVIESEGYVRREGGEPEPLSFPPMTVRPTEDHVRVTGFIYYLASNLPV